MMKLLFLALLAAASQAQHHEHSTKTIVTVIEVGSSGSVRTTTSRCPHATVQGVTSFWSNLHDMDPHGRRPKSVPPAGMVMVPDFFKKANGGLILSLTGLKDSERESMTTLQSILDSSLEDEGSTNVVGHFHVSGAQAKNLVRHASPTIMNSLDTFGTLLGKSVETLVSSPKEENKVQSLSLNLDTETRSFTEKSALFADEAISNMLKVMKQQANNDGSTFVIHLVVEEPNHSHLQEEINNSPKTETESVTKLVVSDSRRLEEAEGEGNQNQGGSIYYGYGYIDANGEYYTPYRTIFQIQFYQVVLWSALGLFSILLLSLNHLINMPLMVDTLLFGESAKVAND